MKKFFKCGDYMGVSKRAFYASGGLGALPLKNPTTFEKVDETFEHSRLYNERQAAGEA